MQDFLNAQILHFHSIGHLLNIKWMSLQMKLILKSFVQMQYKYFCCQLVCYDFMHTFWKAQII